MERQVWKRVSGDGEQGAPVQGDGAGARQIPGGQGGGVQSQRGILFHVQGAGDDLLEEAKNHKFDIVLCKTQSRFTRDMEIVEKYLHNKCIEWNIRFEMCIRDRL